MITNSKTNIGSTAGRVYYGGGAKIISGTQTAPTGDSIKIPLDGSSLSTGLYYFRVYKSSDYPLFTISTDYFIIASTDHELAVNGKVIWGECTDPLGSNFVEKGTIVSGYQAETPELIKITTAESGLGSDEYFLYYHTDTTDPSNSGYQQTHLLTTSGGAAPHLSTWTQQGTVLGLEVGENHTGNFQIVKRGTSDYIGWHLTTSSTWLHSTSTDGLNWTRTAIGVSRNFRYPFTYGGNDYVIATDATSKKLNIYEHDTNYNVTTLVYEIFNFNKVMRSWAVTFENDIMYLIWKTGTGNSDTEYPLLARQFNLRNYFDYL